MHRPGTARGSPPRGCHYEVLWVHGDLVFHLRIQALFFSPRKADLYGLHGGGGVPSLPALCPDSVTGGPTGREKKGGERSPGVSPVGFLLVESPQVVPKPNLNSCEATNPHSPPVPELPYRLPTAAFSGLGEVRSPLLAPWDPALSPVGSLHPAYTFAQILLKSPQIA